VLVTYMHSHGDIPALVSKLQASPPDRTRPVMTLRNPRCTACGARLSRRVLRPRISCGGDLYDARFRYRWLKQYDD